MRELDADPKIDADQLGPSADVNLNAYIKNEIEPRQKALNAMESAMTGA